MKMNRRSFLGGIAGGAAALPLAGCTGIGAGVGGNSRGIGGTDWAIEENGVRMEISEPSIVSLSEPDFTDWGPHQFVSLSEYPGGRILCRFSGDADSIKAYGADQPTYISDDEGQTWQEFSAPNLPKSGVIGKLYDGQYLCLPATRSLDLRTVDAAMPEPLNPEDQFKFYRASECPPAVQEYMRYIDAARWTPETGEWRPEKVEMSTDDLLVWIRDKGSVRHLVSTTWFSRPPVLLDGEIFRADYRRNYLTADGDAPGHLSTSCLVSQDNGRFWSHRSHVAVAENPEDIMAEPDFAETPQGGLVCIIRPGGRQPMHISYSNDKGRTWTPLEHVFEYGVMPDLLSLGCGVMILSYGRPGVKVAFSADGSGREWSMAVPVMDAKWEDRLKNTDGYTALAPLDAHRFLLGYTDFDYKDEEGRQRKAIIVREGRIRKA
jgi:hypothetical protein